MPRDYDNVPMVLNRLMNEEITQNDSILIVCLTSQGDRIKKLERMILLHWLLFIATMSFLVISIYKGNNAKLKANKPDKEKEILHNHRIPVSVGTKTKFINPDEITHCMGAISYTELYCLDGSHYSVSRNISKVEAELSPLGFFRVHRSALVNMGYIKSINNNRVLELENGQQIKIAKSRLPAIRKKMITNS